MEVLFGIVLFVGFGYLAGQALERRKWRKSTGAKSSGEAERLMRQK